MLAIADRYHDLLGLRAEGLRKYRRRFPHDVSGPSSLLQFPALGGGAAPGQSVRIGPIFVTDRPPIVPFARRLLCSSSGQQDVLEIGPGTGSLASYLRTTIPDKIGRYAGLERDQNVAGPYERIASLDDLDFKPSFAIASEVIEHMPLDAGYRLIDGIAKRMRANGALLVGTPNALTPGGVLRDVTHVQAYPWFDLYALLRMRFKDVEIFRTHYVCTPQRLMQVVPRMILCRLQEMDWCEGLIAIARDPIDETFG